jgi:hypothetical protein
LLVYALQLGFRKVVMVHLRSLILINRLRLVLATSVVEHHTLIVVLRYLFLVLGSALELRRNSYVFELVKLLVYVGSVIGLLIQGRIDSMAVIVIFVQDIVDLGMEVGLVKG